MPSTMGASLAIEDSITISLRLICDITYQPSLFNFFVITAVTKPLLTENQIVTTVTTK